MFIKINYKLSDFIDFFIGWPRLIALLFSGIFLLKLIIQAECFSILLVGFFVIIFLVLLYVLIGIVYVLTKKGVLGEHTIGITEDYFYESTAYNDDKHNWKNIKKIVKTRKYITVHISTFAYAPISRKFFTSEEEYEKFYEVATSYHQQAKETAN